MSLSLQALTALMLACAPHVAPETGLRIVRHESASNPYAIGINGPYRLQSQPRTREQALATVDQILKLPQVRSVDLGLAMINSANLPRLGLRLEDVFEPCTNLGAMQTLLQESYARAASRHGPGQKALQQTLSEYNTGHPDRGLRNGYVRKVYLQPLR